MPSGKAKSVGMDLMPAAAEISCSASVSTLANTMSACVSDACSNTGANLRQGPHQPAQKSTSTISCPLTVSQNVSPVSSCVAKAPPIVLCQCQRHQLALIPAVDHRFRRHEPVVVRVEATDALGH